MLCNDMYWNFVFLEYKRVIVSERSTQMIFRVTIREDWKKAQHYKLIPDVNRMDGFYGYELTFLDDKEELNTILPAFARGFHLVTTPLASPLYPHIEEKWKEHDHYQWTVKAAKAYERDREWDESRELEKEFNRTKL